MEKKTGRPPTGERAMTNAEKMAAYRKRQAEGRRQGIEVYMSKSALKSLRSLCKKHNLKAGTVLSAFFEVGLQKSDEFIERVKKHGKDKVDKQSQLDIKD